MPNNDFERVEQELAAARPEALTDAERARVFAAVDASVHARRVASPYFPFAFAPTTMLPIALVCALFLGAGGTALAADAARPGDFLFPVDRAIEDIRLSLSSHKEELRLAFANERLDEFSSIVSEEFGDRLSGLLTNAEADIFTNETIVKLEAGDRKALFSTRADTREEIIAAIHARFGFSEEEIDAVLVVETEDRASRPEDGAVVSATARMRVAHALEVLNEFVRSTRGSASTSPGVLTALGVLEATLLERSSGLPEDIRVRIEDDRARFEVEGANGRTRIEIKDGEIRIKERGDSDDDHDDDSSSSGALEVEADVFTDTTLVKVESNDRKTTFSTRADTRDEVIDEVAKRFPTLTRSQIAAALNFEVENRASRPDDADNRDDDSGDDDDNSGHGGGDDDGDHSGKGREGDES